MIKVNQIDIECSKSSLNLPFKEIETIFINKVIDIINDNGVKIGYDWYSEGLKEDVIEKYENKIKKYDLELDKLNYIILNNEKNNIKNNSYIKKHHKYYNKKNELTNKLYKNNLIIFINGDNLKKYKNLFNSISKKYYFIMWNDERIIYTDGSNIIFGTEVEKSNIKPLEMIYEESMIKCIFKYKYLIEILYPENIKLINIT